MDWGLGARLTVRIIAGEFAPVEQFRYMCRYRTKQPYLFIIEALLLALSAVCVLLTKETKADDDAIAILFAFLFASVVPLFAMLFTMYMQVGGGADKTAMRSIVRHTTLRDAILVMVTTGVIAIDGIAGEASVAEFFGTIARWAAIILSVAAGIRLVLIFVWVKPKMFALTTAGGDAEDSVFNTALDNTFAPEMEAEALGDATQGDAAQGAAQGALHVAAVAVFAYEALMATSAFMFWSVFRSDAINVGDWFAAATPALVALSVYIVVFVVVRPAKKTTTGTITQQQAYARIVTNVHIIHMLGVVLGVVALASACALLDIGANMTDADMTPMLLVIAVVAASICVETFVLRNLTTTTVSVQKAQVGPPATAKARFHDTDDGQMDEEEPLVEWGDM